ncbi:nucleotidyltransferase family protein [Desulfosporosinus fructosivorans]
MGNPIQREAIELFSKSIKEKLSANIKDVRLFGSVARGTDTPESDIDILVLVEKDDRDISDAIMDIVVDINLEYDVVIIPIIITGSHYANPLFRETAFFHNLEFESVTL